MSTMNFSVPEDVKQAFNAAFEGQNKSAVVTALLREAIARANAQERQRQAYQRILANRATAPVVSDEEILRLRNDGRP
ncbi:MAG: hypothetical protein L6Q75_04200 [Burkholderiaceae bacterium]|nr:hypothetical protein [Burkholderiaceae bacterium]